MWYIGDMVYVGMSIVSACEYRHTAACSIATKVARVTDSGLAFYVRT